MLQVQLPLIQVSSDSLLSHRRLPLLEVANEAALEALLASLFPSSSSFYLAFSPDHSRVQVRLRLRGGKGGFGSQLRAQGNKMSSKKRAGNYEACRDLSGQRLRSQKHAKLVSEYLEREPERLSLREREIREKMEKHLEAPNRKVMFNDPAYLKTSRKIVDGTEDAVRSLFADSDSDDTDCDEDCTSESELEAGEEVEADEAFEGESAEESVDSSDDSSEDEKAPLK